MAAEEMDILPEIAQAILKPSSEVLIEEEEEEVTEIQEAEEDLIKEEDSEAASKDPCLTTNHTKQIDVS